MAPRKYLRSDPRGYYPRVDHAFTVGAARTRDKDGRLTETGPVLALVQDFRVGLTQYGLDGSETPVPAYLGSGLPTIPDAFAIPSAYAPFDTGIHSAFPAADTSGKHWISNFSTVMGWDFTKRVKTDDPAPISKVFGWIPQMFYDGWEAALPAPGNTVWLFKAGRCALLDLTTHEVIKIGDEDTPAVAKVWRDLPEQFHSGVDAALVNPHAHGYLFRTDAYAVVDLNEQRVLNSAAIKDKWHGVPGVLGAIDDVDYLGHGTPQSLRVTRGKTATDHAAPDLAALSSLDRGTPASDQPPPETGGTPQPPQRSEPPAPATPLTPLGRRPGTGTDDDQIPDGIDQEAWQALRTNYPNFMSDWRAACRIDASGKEFLVVGPADSFLYNRPGYAGPPHRFTFDH
ncbi:hypothetical protein [Streptomyces buecherae]|uniref:Hemopexin n=1 Tax=Streptomyces buecherae TaxID=2763006 RepID=A0A7H8NGH6_9ACTN|nr:hypothetical protein [Streptomyces buecherae]QKW53599.1 hypothetical protein HUT08_33175 [Streptomyces buecherae]